MSSTSSSYKKLENGSSDIKPRARASYQSENCLGLNKTFFNAGLAASSAFFVCAVGAIELVPGVSDYLSSQPWYSVFLGSAAIGMISFLAGGYIASSVSSYRKNDNNAISSDKMPYNTTVYTLSQVDFPRTDTRNP